MFAFFFNYDIREQVDREAKEKQKILADLEKAEKLKNQLAAEVDEHHSAIEQKNNLNLRSFTFSTKASRELLPVDVAPCFSVCPQEAGAGPQGEAGSGEMGADGGDGAAQAAGRPAARGAGS